MIVHSVAMVAEHCDNVKQLLRVSVRPYTIVATLELATSLLTLIVMGAGRMEKPMPSSPNGEKKAATGAASTNN
jgi:hypothetical protein